LLLPLLLIGLVKAHTYPGYTTQNAQDYLPANFMLQSSEPAQASIAAQNTLQDTESTQQVMAAVAARNRRRQQRRDLLQSSTQLPAHLAADLAELIVAGTPPAVGKSGLSNSSGSGTAGSSRGSGSGTAGSSSSSSNQAAALLRGGEQQQQQQGDSHVVEDSEQPEELTVPSDGNVSDNGSESNTSAVRNNATPQAAVGSSNASDVVAAGASKGSSKRTGNGVPDLPVDWQPVGPRPPCNSSRGFEEQDGVCVCMPGAPVSCFIHSSNNMFAEQPCR
jgi:hypothetical protein